MFSSFLLENCFVLRVKDNCKWSKTPAIGNIGQLSMRGLIVKWTDGLGLSHKEICLFWCPFDSRARPEAQTCNYFLSRRRVEYRSAWSWLHSILIISRISVSDRHAAVLSWMRPLNVISVISFSNNSNGNNSVIIAIIAIIGSKRNNGNNRTVINEIMVFSRIFS